MSDKNRCLAACAEVDITPQYQTTLVGRYRPGGSAGVLHRLWAQVLLLEAGGDSHCLIAIDSLGLTVPLANTIRRQAAAALGAPVSHVMINFSHTHSAPAPTPDALNGERYFDFLCRQVAACVAQARGNLRPCKAGWALAKTAIGENRREGCTVVDDRLGGLLVAEAEGGRPIALVARMSAHANILPGSVCGVSSDFIGVARQQLRGFYGFPVMILQGAAGNIKATGTDDIGEGDDNTLRRVAGMLADDIKGLSFCPRDITGLQMRSVEVICLSDVPQKAEAEAMAAGYNAPLVQSWLSTCDSLRQQGISTQETAVEINLLKINEGCLCGVPEEIFCELAIDAQARTGNSLFFLNGYTNGCMSYLPSRAQWHKGGFEVLQSNFT